MCNVKACLTHPELLHHAHINSGKFECIQAIVSDSSAKGDKIVIVSYYSQTLDIVERSLLLWGISFLRLDGKVPNN